MVLNKVTRPIFLYSKQHGACPYCNVKFIKDDETIVECNIDHVIPLSRGGKDDISNMVLACVSCNSAKGAMSADEFATVSDKIKNGEIKKEDLGDYLKYLSLKVKFNPK